MVTTLLQIAMHTIWFNRNQQKFHKNQVHIRQSINTITKHFNAVIKHKFQKHWPGNLDKFKVNYCHSPEICDVVDGKLQVHFLEPD